MNESADRGGLGNHLMQQSKTFSFEPGGKLVRACHVPAGTVEARNQTKFHRVFADGKYQRDHRRRFLRCKRAGIAGRNDHRSSMPDEFRYEPWEAIEFPFGKTVLDGYILAGDITRLLQAIFKGLDCRAQGRA